MTRHIAICCRISKAPNGRTEGVKSQEKWGREYAASAWPDLSVEVFADNNLSAMNGGPRPEHDRFREWVAAGRIAHVWAVEQSRLERDEIAWFQLAAELDAAGITEVHTNRDGIVRVRDEVAGIKAVLNAGEVRKLKRRVNDRLAEVAAAGRPPGGHCFGYRHVKDADGNKTLEVVPEEAEAIRWAAEKILAGWSLSNIAAELTARGLRGSLGGKIAVNSVRSAVTSPTVAGLRVYQGRIVGRGVWAPILDEQTRQAVKAKLDADRVVRRSDGRDHPIGARRGQAKGRRYLLTGGLAVCGVCGAQLIGAARKLRRAGVVQAVPYLQCSPLKGGRACVGIMLEPTEVHVVDQLFAELDKPAFLDALAADDSAERRTALLDQLDAAERQRSELAALWARPGELTAAEWGTARRAIAEHEQQLRAELAAIPAPMAGLDIADARGTWPDMTLDEKREFLRLFIAKVTVHRAVPGTKGFDSGRVEIEWQQR